MRNDYKSHNDLFGKKGQNRHSRLGLLAIAGLALSATAIYAALGPGNNNTQAETTQVTLPASGESAAGTEPEAATPGVRKVALPLPSITGPTEQPPKTAPLPAAEITAKPTDFNLPPLRPALRMEDEAPEQEGNDNAQDTEQLVALDKDTDFSDTAPSSTGTGNTKPVTVSELDSPAEQGRWLEEQVKQGDSLARIFSRLDLSANLLHRIVNSSPEAKGLASIRPGEKIRVRLDPEGDLLELVHQQSRIRSLQILPDGEGFNAKILDRNLETRIARASGTITSSLYLSAQRAGLSDTLTMELANIFGWDIDFALEIRAGDQFSLIYEEEYLDGEKFRNGAILAAEFINQGKIFRAIRFEDEEGYASYYSPEGESMRKAFLRAPVDFRRISSRFTKARYHPVLGKKRPHRGVDYAAAIGTPIKASGDGRVIFRGTKGGYGRTIMIRHGSQYTTLYAHMSKFRGAVRQGSRVRQGQVIGYVGKSGLATGPHLHYEFRVNGVHRNPLTIKLPAAEPLNEKYRARFAELSAPLLSQLDLISKTMVADAR
ncbi:MAG: peptidoglycan DD-metalloendopeptidase family protein [Sedimenticola sp.]|nr:peptidoglycan DD-metalloendopeptidase family protein [Sedimenticola sp.]